MSWILVKNYPLHKSKLFTIEILLLDVFFTNCKVKCNYLYKSRTQFLKKVKIVSDTFTPVIGLNHYDEK